ncbi:MAG: DUF86 domain-containing protein [Candidatus Pacebacteria bacterium]|nr:DUF86 domain-containing protein [Candidatus Paceibacterota bacterium]
MTISQQLITQKLTALGEYEGELQALLARMSDAEILTDTHGSIHAAERLVQLIADTMVDINQHIMRNTALPFEDSTFSTFTIISEHGVVPRDLALRLAPITGMRNILVHQYEKIDKELFLRKTREHLGDIPEYARHILAYMEKNPA